MSLWGNSKGMAGIIQLLMAMGVVGVFTSTSLIMTKHTRAVISRAANQAEKNALVKEWRELLSEPAMCLEAFQNQKLQALSKPTDEINVPTVTIRGQKLRDGSKVPGHRLGIVDMYIDQVSATAMSNDGLPIFKGNFNVSFVSEGEDAFALKPASIGTYYFVQGADGVENCYFDGRVLSLVEMACKSSGGRWVASEMKCEEASCGSRSHGETWGQTTEALGRGLSQVCEYNCTSGHPTRDCNLTGNIKPADLIGQFVTIRCESTAGRIQSVRAKVDGDQVVTATAPSGASVWVFQLDKDRVTNAANCTTDNIGSYYSWPPGNSMCQTNAGKSPITAYYFGAVVSGSSFTRGYSVGFRWCTVTK